MTTALIVGGAVALFGALLWLFGRSSKEEGRQEVIAQVNKEEVENVKKTSEVMAEHRSDDDTARRLRDGNF